MTTGSISGGTAGSMTRRSLGTLLIATWRPMSLPGMPMIVASRTLRDITAAATLNLNGASTCVANYYCLIARVMSRLRRRLLSF